MLNSEALPARDDVDDVEEEEEEDNDNSFM